MANAIAKQPDKRKLKRNEAGLTLPQRKFIEAFVYDPECRGSVTRAVEKAKRSRSAVYRWIGEEETFRNELEKTRLIWMATRGIPIDDATMARAAEKDSSAADKRLALELLGRLRAAGTQVNVAIVGTRPMTREECMRQLRAHCRALKLQGDEGLREKLAEKHGIIDTEFIALATETPRRLPAPAPDTAETNAQTQVST